jgi:acetoin utilization deacetylase AcuC-like enzyme
LSSEAAASGRLGRLRADEAAASGRLGRLRADEAYGSRTRRRRYGNAIAAPLLLRHASSLEHDTGAHPERAERVRAIERELAAHDWLGWERRESPPAELDRITAVHPGSYVEAVREVTSRGAAFDLDTPTSPGSWDAALHAAGGACVLVEELLGGRAPTGFSIHRPPGHHAEAARAMGFCLFNNVAVGAAHALERCGAERVLVLDWDVHHGNGTNAIFHDRSDVLFASIHQWPFYPGSGMLDDAGAGPGEGFSINLPVPAGSGPETWLPLLEHIVAPAAREYRPDLVLISAGYDAHRDDPLADCLLETSDFAAMAAHVRELGAELGAPVGAVLEGGYDVDALAASVAATLSALSDGVEPPSTQPVGPLLESVRQQVRRHWRL